MELMPMLASSTPPPLEGAPSSRGFTLLEVLTVLFIVGLVGALVFPNFPVLIDRIVNANERDSVIRSLNTLSYEAFARNQDYVLTGTYNDRTSGAADFEEAAIFSGTSFRSHGISPAQIILPDGWTLSVKKPIFYRASGFCSGGSVQLNTGIVTTEYVLSAPTCQLEGQ